MSDEISFNTKRLDALIKAFGGDLPKVRVGVLGDSSHRIGGEGPTNAEVGASHEFGTSKMPVRSFLRVPISENLMKYLEKGMMLDKKELELVVQSSSILAWVAKIGITAERIVQDAFSSGGFGKWPSWKTPGYQNNTGQLLVDTQQLRNSITSEVKK